MEFFFFLLWSLRVKIETMEIDLVVKAIKGGKVVLAPTDTVYGLICDATNKKAVEKIFKIKKRPKNKPVPVFVSDIEMAKKIAEIDAKQEKFLKTVWPGATTCVLTVKGGGGTIGIRIPKNNSLLNLVKQLGGPLAETSANISGNPASTKINEVLAQFEGQEEQPDLVIDGGDLPPAKPSTVIDLRFSSLKILRQ
ncbi:MAG: threonylcarbamoyl-AMP synthase [Candidatus Nealsonbacteria bacterium]|nr:threonylcarbamoyl-AMP synthase [Candidatus Nealsonbacteria bacterium]